MKRREFSLLVATAAVGAAASAQTIDPDFSIEGRFQPVTPPQATETPKGTIEVVDVFGYRCPHCFNFLPVMERYQQEKPDYVQVRGLPAIFRPSWEAPAQAFYTAKLLGVLDQLHRPIFEALHVARKPMSQDSDWRELFVAHGVSADKFDLTFSSFAVETLMRKSVIMQGRYGITGTPSLVVNGKYRVPAGTAGTYENIVSVAKALIKIERDAQGQG